MTKKTPTEKSEEITNATESTKTEINSKPRTTKAKRYCVRAICPKCGTRTFETIEVTDEPKRGDTLDKRCRQEECGGTLQVISIYSKE